MNPDAGHSPSCLPALDDLPGEGRILLAFSGGADSVCLAALLARAGLSRDLQCIHVDHGLDPASPDRARKAMELAAGLGLSCQVENAVVDTDQGIEAGARKARYAILTKHLGPGEVLLTAHHADDQAETVLMRLMRGAGPAGLAGIPRLRRFADGWLVRPLLDWSRDDIRAWLGQQGLEWIEDPANQDSNLDRNYITHEIMPALLRRWPSAVDSIRRSARLCDGAASTLAETALADMMRFNVSGQRLQRAAAEWLDNYRFTEMLRYWCHHLGHSAPPASRLEEFISQLHTAAPDRQPELRWENSVLHAHGDWLWLESGEPAPDDWSKEWSGQTRLTLPGRVGTLEIKGPSFSSDPPLMVQGGHPGEKIRVAGQSRPVSVRKLLYNSGIPPWQRDLWPRLWLEQRLVALGDVWLDPDFAEQLERDRLQLEWKTSLYRPGAGLTP